MDILLNKFRNQKHCDKCTEYYSSIEGCMFKCGHIYHIACITSMETPCCYLCNYSYNPKEIYELSSKFMNKLLMNDCSCKLIRKNISKKAVDLLIEAALLNHSESQYIIGIDEFKNGYMEKLINKEESIFWLKKAANNKNLKAILTLMDKYETINPLLYYDYCEMAANQNDSNSQLIIAKYYEKIDSNKCIYYMNMAASNNNVFAYEYLYTYYKDGMIVTKNIDLAYNYLNKAAELGSIESQILMGDFYYIKNIYDKAIYWYKIASDNGNHDAQIQMANYYIFGENIEQNYTLAYKLLQKNKENVFAMYLLGYYYEHYKENLIESFIWYMKSAKKDYNKAQHKIAYLYDHGLGINHDHNQSIEWLIKAANNNYLDSQIILGKKYEIGFNYKGNFIQSDKKAKKYYKLAASSGDLFSINALYFYELLDRIK